MPWTFAHPAAILPLRQVGGIRWSLVGLIVGSLVPDLGYHLGRHDIAGYAHTAAGLLVVCLPAGLLIALLLVRHSAALIAPLPQPHRARLLAAARSAGPGGVQGLLWIASSIVLGSATHLAWDAFTHAHGQVVRHWPVLRQVLGSIAGHPVPIYNALQHLSTVVGVAVLLAAYRRWAAGEPRCAGSALAAPGERQRLAALLGCLLLAVLLGTALGFQAASGESAMRMFVVRSAIHGASAFMALYVLLAIAWSRARADRCG